MGEYLAIIIISLIFFAFGVVTGWHQRNIDKKRDNYEMAEHILRSCETVKPKLRAVK